MRIVFWQKELSFHQAPHIRALAARHDVVWVVHEQLAPYRQSMGWSVPDSGAATVVVAPDSAQIDALLAERPEDSVHVFAGITGHPTIKEGFERCVALPLKMGMLTESRDGRGWQGVARFLVNWRQRRQAGGRIRFILCMGYTGKINGGRQWFRRCGYPAEKLFPYGYFIEPPARSHVPLTRHDGPVRLLYLGRFVKDKGGDLLLTALRTLTDLDWKLTLIGDGPERDAWVQLARKSRLEARVEFLPFLPNAEAMEQVAASDLFVLPTLFDGWGVVVNEALMRGVPVVTSDRCGAADLLQDPERGAVFPSGSAPSLARVLRREIARGPRTPEQTARLQSWSRCLEGDVAAEYFLQVLAHCFQNGPRPTPPWLSPTTEGYQVPAGSRAHR